MTEESSSAVVDESSRPGPRTNVLSPADRKRLLGRLAEFELMLLALPPARQNFVMAYLMDPTDGAKAARVAGYSERRASTTAATFLNDAAIAACVALGEQLREDRTMITSDRTLHEIALIAFSDITHYEVAEGGRVRCRPGIPEYATRAISSVEWTTTTVVPEKGKGDPIVTVKTKIRLWPKDTALRMLAMYQNLLNPDGGTTVINQQITNDNRGQQHTHNHLHQTWKIGETELTF